MNPSKIFQKMDERFGKSFRQLFQYLIVGGIATIVEWVCFYLFSNVLDIFYLLATALAFVVSTFANWLAGKIIMFKNWDHVLPEIVKVYLTSIVGLLLNLLLMWIMVSQMHLVEMLAKIIATCIVFAWNFLIRKFVIYKV